MIQTSTVIAPRGFIYFTEADLGFSLNAAGESIYFKTPGGSRVLDALRFGAQENGVSYGGFPDGGEWSRLGEHGKWGAEFYRCLCRGRERTNCSKAWQGAPAW